MNVSNNEKVNEFLADIQLKSAQQLALLCSIRTLFLDANESLEESIKYGGLVFTSSGYLLGGIYVYKAHISIEFSDGAGLIDADGFLEGQGQKRRHLKIRENADITTKNSAYYIAQAVAN